MIMKLRDDSMIVRVFFFSLGKKAIELSNNLQLENGKYSRRERNDLSLLSNITYVTT